MLLRQRSGQNSQGCLWHDGRVETITKELGACIIHVIVDVLFMRLEVLQKTSCRKPTSAVVFVRLVLQQGNHQKPVRGYELKIDKTLITPGNFATKKCSIITTRHPQYFTITILEERKNF